MVAVLWRYAGSPTAEGGSYSDAAEISSYAAAAAVWAHANSLVRPTFGDMFTPKANATRAQVANILMRYAFHTIPGDGVPDVVTQVGGGPPTAALDVRALENHARREITPMSFPLSA